LPDSCGFNKYSFLFFHSKKLMKSNGNLRGTTNAFGPEDMLRKATKLPPLKKSGKEKRSFYRELDEDDDDFDLQSYQQRESVLDYYDDGEEDGEDEWLDEEEESGFEEDLDEEEEDWEE